MIFKGILKNLLICGSSTGSRQSRREGEREIRDYCLIALLCTSCLLLTFSLQRRFSMSYKKVRDAFVTSVRCLPVRLNKIHESTVPVNGSVKGCAKGEREKRGEA